MGYDYEDYKNFLTSELKESLLEHETFCEYKKAFESNNDIKSLKKQRNFKEKSEELQNEELLGLFIDYAKQIEKEKMYFFVLAFSNKNVVIIKSPTENKKQKSA